MSKGIIPDNLLGVYAEIAEIIGVENTYLLYENLHGQQYLFPQRFYKPEYVTERIRNEYDGRNCRELAKKYNYSERRIRQMLKE